MHPVDLAVSAIAAGQCGTFHRRQVLACGGDDRLIQRRCRAGRWAWVAPGVYALPGHPPSFRRSVWISWLAGSDEAVVSHWTGGAIRDLEGFARNRLMLTVPHGLGRANPVAQVFQSVAPPKVELVTGLPVASVERIFVDIARFCGPRKLQWLVDAARTDGRTSVPRLRSEFLRLARSGRDGITTMRTVLDTYEEGPVPSRAELERHLDAILACVPAPVLREAPLPGREWSKDRVDRRFDWPRRLLVEGDSRRWHTRVADFRRDRQRDRDALRAGYPTVRYAYEEVVEEKEAVLEEILDLLGIPEGLATGFR